MNELKEIYKFLKDHTPLIIDLDGRDLVYDKNSMYYKTYKYLYNLVNRGR